MSDLYRLRNLSKRFGGREVLSIPALDLRKGVIYGLLGPNGAGKTTLMRLLSFIETPTEGEIAFMGEEVQPESGARLRSRVVWVPQTPVMFTGSLLYNVEYPMALKGVPRSRRKDRAMQLLEGVGLAALADAPAPRLSGGEAQRGSIARALAAGAEVILFDEPTASVDFRSRSEIIELIHALNSKNGLSLIVTTHDRELADELCRDRIILFDGKIVPEYPHAARARLSTPTGRLQSGDSGLEIHLPPDSAALLPAFVSLPCGAVVSGVGREAEGIFLRLSSEAGTVPALRLLNAENGIPALDTPITLRGGGSLA